MMHTYGDHVSGWGYALGITGMILFWGLLAVAIAAAARYLGRNHRGGRTAHVAARAADARAGAR